MRLRVAPDRAIATLRAGWPRQGELAKAQCPLVRAASAGPELATDAEHELSRHADAITAALRELDRTSPLKGAALDVGLSSVLVHIDVVEGDFRGQSSKQLQLIATACVVELLGDATSGHEVRWELQSDERHLLIFATSRGCLQMLNDIAAEFGLRLRSITPDFVVEWNAFGQAVSPGCSVFAVAEGAHIAIAAVVEGAICGFSMGSMYELPAQPLDKIAAASETEAQAEARREAERSLATEQLDSRIDDLWMGLGLTRHSRSSFSPSMPRALEHLEMLDSRVDRLLAGMGQSPSAESAFVLVTPDDTLRAASRRWTVFGEDGQPA